ncbi:conserved hypothetical protein [Talaromyces stipitatus ATCC 10500]|uniref:Zn(2)-C6 fungal-type domain-containing protein n=1 Tax=Talaromyces stipitatus (strain ATCC 10500 / CBS 375.48 / QM 6759 / NRRL 1006) TaxID=441959 RepID=B8MUU5_TALSN|nr:uncharacterized protein TSTA_110450 [Talaromyces stipitatus ATCC 10500]EED11865.1 conserved hypothetical protein [Talaromyces stipitatus ATCC 10500]
MAAVHSQTQGSHHLRPPLATGSYQRPDMYALPPLGPRVAYRAATPRQRTAIACLYCRRRKIRCFVLESSSNGRCTHCVRFNQECIFKPVSSQTQAFVLAHAAYSHPRPRAQEGRDGYPGDKSVLNGAHGQSLPPQDPVMAERALPPLQGAYYHPHGCFHVDNRILPPLQHQLFQDQCQRGGWRSSGAALVYPEPINLAPVSTGPPATGYSLDSYYHSPPPPSFQMVQPVITKQNEFWQGGKEDQSPNRKLTKRPALHEKSANMESTNGFKFATKRKIPRGQNKLSKYYEAQNFGPKKARIMPLNRYLNKIGASESDICACTSEQDSGTIPIPLHEMDNNGRRYELKHKLKMRKSILLLRGKSRSDPDLWQSDMKAAHAILLRPPKIGHRTLWRRYMYVEIYRLRLLHTTQNFQVPSPHSKISVSKYFT